MSSFRTARFVIPSDLLLYRRLVRALHIVDATERAAASSGGPCTAYFGRAHQAIEH